MTAQNRRARGTTSAPIAQFGLEPLRKFLRGELRGGSPR